MRRFLTAVVVAGVVCAAPAFAQDTTEETRVQVVGQTEDAPANAVGLQFHSMLAFPAGGAGYSPGITLTYERAFSDLMSLHLAPGLTFLTIGMQFGVDAELRFHIIGESLNGLYIAPTAGFFLNTTGGSPIALGMAPFIDFGAVVGYSYLINNAIQLNVGVGFTYNILMLPAPAATTSFAAIPIRVGVAYAF